MGASFGLGLLLEKIISTICFSKAVQKKPINRIITYTSIFLVFLVAQYISVRWMGVSMLDYVSDEIVSVIGMPILGFAVNLLIRWYRIRKIRKLYGDGSEGFVFDVKKEVVEEMGGEKLSTFVHPVRAVYLLGSEVDGLPREVLSKCQHVVEIESVNYASFNVAVSGSLVMYHRLINKKL